MEVSTTVTVALAVGIPTIGYLGKELIQGVRNKIASYDKHLEECHGKAIEFGVLETKLSNMQKQVAWQGDCTIIIATTLNAKIPDRPDPV